MSKALSERLPVLDQNPHLAEAIRKQAIEITVEPYLILPENAEKFLMNVNASAASREMFETRIQQSWITVHHILVTMMRIERYFPQINGGASVSKAVDFLDKMKKPNVMGNKSDIYKAWKEYKGIAHYLLPFFMVWADPEKNAFCHFYDISGIRGFLVLAGNIQKWMLTLKPSHSKQAKVFTKQDLWTMPRWCKVQNFSINVTPFSSEEIAVIKSYKRF